MGLRATVLACLVVAAVAVPLAGAGGTAGQHVRIDVSGGPSGGNPEGGSGRFTLSGGTARDAGTQSYSFSFASGGPTAAGQPISRVRGTVTLFGKDGTLELVTRGTAYSATGDGASSGRDVWTGTWRVARAGGSYAGTTGSGAYVGIVGPSYRVALRLDGHMG